MRILQRLAGNRFLVIGRAGMDLCPEPAGVSIEQAASFSASLGGSSANICAALVRQGTKASLVTCVSDDAIGRYCLSQLDAYGIEREYVRSVGGEFRNSLALSESRIEDHQTVIYRNGAADFQMNNFDIVGIDFSVFSGLITTGTVLAAEPSRSAAFDAFERAKMAMVPLIFDLDYRPYSWASAQEASAVYSDAARSFDIIIGNDVEFGFMAGDYEKGLAKARALADDGAAIVVYKMGEKGAITFAADKEIRTGIYPAKALKPTGAGDAFMGGLIASLANGRSLNESLLRGSACASMVVERVGCAPAMPHLDELDAFLAAQPEYVE
ncbi:MAG: 5-dehydro-2-deoxygluconokinase [Granulosicoccus sp.]|nr:5-dehydro-2-deoxygluconokinase [Granulosicoccus sp.]